MDKDLEKRLKQDELYEFYIQNPNQQKHIEDDYQREKEAITDINKDYWIEWMTLNPDLGEKYYPLIMKGLVKRMQDTPPFITANIIQKLPNQFATCKAEIKKHEGKVKSKKIKEQIELLNTALGDGKFEGEIIKNAINSVRDELTDQLKYWELELKALVPQPINNELNRTKEVITDYFERMHVDGYEYAFRSENDYNTFINILINNFESKKYDLPQSTIQLKRGCKTKLAGTLGKIHSELSNKDVFKSDVEFFKIVKCLNLYSNLTNTELYTALTRNRKDY